jgi:hypothetical protein
MFVESTDFYPPTQNSDINILRLFVDKYRNWGPGKLPYLAMFDISPNSGRF